MARNKSRPVASLNQKMFNEELRENSVSFLKYYEHLAELSMVMFEWKNLPKTIDERYLERALFRNGNALFFYDDVMGCLCLRCALAGPFDVYDIPTRRRAYAANGYSQERDETNSVIIWNNYLHTNSMLSIRDYATRLSDLEQAIDVNCKAQKTPVMVLCDENERLTMQNLYRNFEGNWPFIFGAKDLYKDGIKSLSTGAPFVADKMYQIKMQIWNEALTDLGISNVSYQKKERLVSDEVIRNMGGTIASRYSRLEMRKIACDQINDMFGDKLENPIEVDYREDFRQTDDENMIRTESEAEDKEATPMVVDLRTR